MNAVIALCHFCELHGPSILFCTQAFHSHDPQQLLDHDTTLEDSNSHQIFGLPGCRENVRSPLTVGSVPVGTSLGISSMLNQPQTPTTPTTPTLPINPNRDMCEACRLFSAGQTGFISNDNEAKVSYISSQYPTQPQVFTMVRQACVRSLSCEVCQGREGPIFFGDAHRGHVLSHTFFIKDSQARGFQRWYSIIVVMMDKIFLLNSWPFLVTNIRRVITGLQKKADSVYESEQARCPQRAHRLTMSMAPSNYLHQRGGGNKPARSLYELTNDKNVFKVLHKSFTWILKAGGRRLTERLQEGNPTEDSIVDLEKQEETEEGFVKVYSLKVQEEPQEDELDETIDDIDPNAPRITSLRHLLKVLSYPRFHELAHHVVIGNQIIVRGKDKALIRSIIDSLKVLLPRGCCRAIYYSHKYEDSWRCNFLGLPSDVQPPENTLLYVTLDIQPPCSPTTCPEGATEGSAETWGNINQDWSKYMFEDYTFVVTTPMQMSQKCPAVLSKMELALMNDSMADVIVEQCLICLKEEWMNKVKVLFKFTKAGGNRSDEDTRKLLTVVGAQEEDKAVLKFWMTGLSVQYRNHMLSSAIQQSVSS